MSQENGSLPSRREALLFGLAALVPARVAAREKHGHGDHGTPSSIQRRQTTDDPAAAPLSSPWTAGQPRERITRYDNDPQIIAIEERIRCTCGCKHSIYVCRTTDFNCGFWQALHAKVIDQVEAGLTADQIVAAYRAEHGEEFLMAPPPRGFNLMAYFVPGVLITIVGGMVGMILTRRARMVGARAAAPVDAAPAAGLSAEDEARINEELQRLDF